MKKIKRIIRDVPQHWVGDGFPVRSLFSYGGGNEFDPFLLLDYAGPHEFSPSNSKRGVECILTRDSRRSRSCIGASWLTVIPVAGAGALVPVTFSG
ncbi:MAG: hypothetical protein R3C56_07645 [Pirellulaceae bacterium]